ncbi:hypothetical protein N0647_31710, partial [Pseudomonas aeruginosa]|nr:hypothetical protein [Pseudomonas aeruginosa]MCT1106543.1 hypothetical protein [Pseudomonas aeruginosa]
WCPPKTGGHHAASWKNRGGVLARRLRCINFPMLASVLAGLEEENSKAQGAIYLSLFATAIAIVSVIVTWLTKG